MSLVYTVWSYGQYSAEGSGILPVCVLRFSVMSGVKLWKTYEPIRFRLRECNIERTRDTKKNLHAHVFENQAVKQCGTEYARLCGGLTFYASRTNAEFVQTLN